MYFETTVLKKYFFEKKKKKETERLVKGRGLRKKRLYSTV